MKICQSCGRTEIDDEKIICDECGNKLDEYIPKMISCPLCGAENNPSSSSCHNCGIMITPTVPKTEAMKKNTSTNSSNDRADCSNNSERSEENTDADINDIPSIPMVIPKQKMTAGNIFGIILSVMMGIMICISASYLYKSYTDPEFIDLLKDAGSTVNKSLKNTESPKTEPAAIVEESESEAILNGHFSENDTLHIGEYSWRVLEKNEDRALVISNTIIGEQAYHQYVTDITWEKCSLRKYLNEDFYNTFSDEEKQFILNTELSHKNPKYDTSGGSTTIDRVFLLSIDEANKYFSSDISRIAYDKSEAVFDWWLRSPGMFQNDAAYIDIEGSVRENGILVSSEKGIRPAMWIGRSDADSVYTAYDTADDAADMSEETNVTTEAEISQETEASVPENITYLSGKQSFKSGSITLASYKTGILESYNAYVSIPDNPDAAAKIETDINEILHIDDDSLGLFSRHTTSDSYGIRSIAEYNGYLFLVINHYVVFDDSPPDSFSYSYIYDLKTGDGITLYEIITNIDDFLMCVDDYMYQLVKENRDGKYDKADNYSYYDIYEGICDNSWLFNDYSDMCFFDGNDLIIYYYHLLGYAAAYRETEFRIPLDVWKQYIVNNDAALSTNTAVPVSASGDGNTPGNYANYSSFCEYNGKVYMAGGDDGYSWKVCVADLDGRNRKVLCDDMTDMVITDGSYIYYRNASDNYCLYRLNMDGSGKAKLTSNKASNVRLYNGEIYYTDGDTYNKMKPDGTGRVKLLDDKCRMAQIYDNKITYISSDGRTIYTYSMLTGEHRSNDNLFEIKRFFVTDDLVVMMTDLDSTHEQAIQILNIKTDEAIQFAQYWYPIVGINHDKDYIYAVMDSIDEGEVLIKIPKNDINVHEYINFPGFNGREFYIIGDYIYQLDADGVLSVKEKP